MAAELRTVPAVTFICRPCLRHLSRLCLLICRNVNTDTAADTDDTLADGDGDDDKERGHEDTQHCHYLVTQYPTHTDTDRELLHDTSGFVVTSAATNESIISFKSTSE